MVPLIRIIFINCLMPHLYSHKKGFSILEVSIGIAVIAILGSVFISALRITNISTAGQIYSEFSMYRDAIRSYWVRYGMYPGLSGSDVLNRQPYAFCVTDQAINELKAYRRYEAGACMFKELAILGMIPAGLVDIESSLNRSLGSGLPAVARSSDKAWFMITICRECFRGGTSFFSSYPLEQLSKTVDAANTYRGSHALNIAVARSGAVYDTGIFSNTLTGSLNPSNSYQSDLAALPVRISQIIDSKFDDGFPYSGLIFAGRNVSGVASGSSATAGCTLLTDTFSLDASYLPNATYNKRSNDKCIVSFVLEESVLPRFRSLVNGSK